MQLEDKLAILADSAKYDVACTSSGVDRAGVHGKLGCSVAAGICHSFTPDGRGISLLKVLYSNGPAVMIAVIVSTAAPTMYPVRPLPRGNLQN